MDEERPVRGLMRRSSGYDLLQDVTSFDTGAVFLVKALFYPVTAVGLLALCLWVAERPYTGAHFLMAVLTFAGTAEFLGDVRIDRDHPAPRELRWLWAILVRWLAICACVALVLYLAGINVALTDPALIVWVAITPFVQWTGAMKVRQLLIYVGIHSKKPRTAVIVGVNAQGLVLSRMLQHQPLLGIKLLGFFEDRRGTRTRPPPQSVLGRMEDVAAFVSKYGVNVVYITLPISPRPGLVEIDAAACATRWRRSTLFRICTRSTTSRRVSMCCTACPCLRSMSRRSSACDRWRSAPATSYCPSCSCLFVWPVLVAVAIGVKRTSKGPAIFKQLRYGLDGREIMVYKFRSMTVTEDGATQLHAGHARRQSCDAVRRVHSPDLAWMNCRS